MFKVIFFALFIFIGDWWFKLFSNEWSIVRLFIVVMLVGIVLDEYYT